MEQDEIETKSLPNLYCSLRIKGWHTDYSAYLFINVVLKKFGFVLVGYQDEMNRKEKSAFFERWNNSFKAKYKEDNNLKAFSFIGKDEDENAINAGYFKIIEGMSGKLFNPEQISDFQDNFYWGYSYDFQIAEKNSYFENIPKDFKKLLDCFLTPDPSEKRRTKN